MRRLVAALVLAAVVAASCSDDGPAGDQARLRVDGSATVSGADGSDQVVTDDTTLSFGDTVVLDEGTGSLEFADGSRYELRAGVGGAGGTEGADSTVRVGAPPELLAGDVLVSDGFPASVSVDTTTLSASGVLEVDADERRATAFTGRTSLAGVGDLHDLPGLRSVLLSPAAVPEPLTYHGDDPWDRRYLGEAIAFGRRLEALARGYTSRLGPGATGSVGFFESVLPSLRDEREFTADLLLDRPAGETLIGAAIAVEGRQGNFRERWREIFRFRDAGAAWGLVALEQGVSSAPVLQTIELAIARSDEPDLSTTTTSTSTSSTTSTSGPSSSTTSPTTTTTTSTTTTTVPGGGGILDPLLDPSTNAVRDLLESLGLG